MVNTLYILITLDLFHKQKLSTLKSITDFFENRSLNINLKKRNRCCVSAKMNSSSHL